MNRSVFDVATILGIGTPSTKPLPVAEEGCLIVRIPDGLSLQVLRDSGVGRQLLRQQHWYDKYQWSKESLPAGTYRVRIPVPNSKAKTPDEQRSVGHFAPVALVAAALLCCRVQKGLWPDPLEGDILRCREEVEGRPVELTWLSVSILSVDCLWGGERHDFLWASSFGLLL